MAIFSGRIAVALIGVIMASGAQADWRYAHWGMMPQQLSDASGGAVRAMSDLNERSCVFKGTTCLAFIPKVSIPPYSFEVRFGFANDAKLNSVLLVGGPGLFNELDRALQGKYGKPVSGDNGFLANRIWRDVAGANSIRLMDMNDQVVIQYTPIVNGL